VIDKIFSMLNKKLLAVLQVVLFVVMITVNALANILPINGYNTGQISGMYPNLFVPAGFTFSIWGIIYLLLLAWVIYSGVLLWKEDDKHALSIHAVKVAPVFILTCVLNSTWIVIWHYLQPVLALLVMLWLLRALIAIYMRMQQNRNAITQWQWLVLYVPFVIYLAWICVATIANTAAVLVAVEWNGFGMEPWLWSCSMIVIATILSVYFGYVKAELAFTAVVTWALFGIYKGQLANNNAVAVTAIVCGIISLLAGVMGAVRRSRQTPLEGII
jgi:translocator protein